MEFDVLLMTRTMKQDYTWFYCPDYVDHSVDHLLRPLFMTVENQRNREIFKKDGSHNCFFLLERNYCMLVYLYFTGRQDSSGREIYALEGMACEKKDSRTFWKLLPFLIQEIYGCTLEEQYGLFSEEGSVGSSRMKIRLDSLEDYLKRGTEELLEEFREYDDSFLNMLEETRKSGKMYPFIYGNRTSAFPTECFERFYQWGEERKNYSSDGITYAFRGEEEPVRSVLFFEKKEQNFQAGGGLTDEEGKALLEWKEYLPVPRDGVSLWLLAGLEVQIEELADFYGYRLPWRIEERTPVQRRLAFQWLMIPVPELRLSVQRFAGRMDQLEGCLEEYRDEEDQLFFQLYQYARRIGRNFFSRSEGRETLYLMTMPSGLWIFSFLKESDGYWMRGIRIQPEEQERAWLFLDRLLKDYLLTDPGTYTGEFGEIVSTFLAEAGEMLLPASFILSIFPEENFPHMKNVRIRTGPGRARAFQKIVFHGEPLGEKPENVRQNPESGTDREGRTDEPLLCPPRFGRRWKVSVPQNKGGGEIKMSCIRAAGGNVYRCDAENFFEEGNFFEKCYDVLQKNT